MAELEGVIISRGQGGLGRRIAGTDSHLALIIAEIGDIALDAVVSNNGKGIVLTAVSDALELGLTEAASANFDTPFFEHITEFFRLAPEGTLYLFNDVAPAGVVDFLKANKEIKGFAIVDDFVLADQATLIGSYQDSVIDLLKGENRLIDFGVLGFNNFAMADAIDLTELAAGQISVLVVGSGSSNMAASGALLGMIAARKVNENVGSVNIINKPLEKRGTADYPLTDKNKGLWLDPVLTSGAKIATLTKANIESLEDKGYIFAASYEGYPGIFFTNSKTCISESSDYSFIENNRVWNKAARAIRIALLPLVKGVVKKDAQTGYIKSTTATSWTNTGRKPLEQMVSDDEISGFDLYIDPKQVVNSTQPVIVKASVVADGIVHSFTVELGLTNSIN